VTALFTTAAIFSLSGFGDDPEYLSDPSYGNDYSGNYYRADNGTWLYNVTSVSTYSNDNYGDYFYNYTRQDWQMNTTVPDTSSVERDCSPYFDNCIEQDRYINKLWDTKNQRYATTVLMGAVQWLCVLMHFILFVWACVDTHRRNAGMKQKKVNAVADRVIQDMQARGLITVNGATGRNGIETQALMAGAAGTSTAGSRPASAR